MSARYDCADTQQRDEGLVAAVSAVQEGQLVVLPTDTVYGLGADAFNPKAVTACSPPRDGAGTCRRPCSSAACGRPRR